MNVDELKSVLARLGQLYAAAGATAAAKDFETVVRIFDGHEYKTVDEFVSETTEFLKQGATLKKVVTVNEAAIATYSQRLLDAGLDQVAFAEILEALDRDKTIKKVEWASIANVYINAPSKGEHLFKYTTIKDARSAIREAFIERFESDSKLGIIQRITGWAS
jgi:hypothetical protein